MGSVIRPLKRRSTMKPIVRTHIFLRQSDLPISHSHSCPASQVFSSQVSAETPNQRCTLKRNL